MICGIHVWMNSTYHVWGLGCKGGRGMRDVWVTIWMGVVVVRLRWVTMCEKEGGGEILVCIGSGCVWCMENVDVWVCGFMREWVQGVWVQGCMGVSVCGYKGVLGVWVQGYV